MNNQATISRTTPDIFGASSMGYALIESRHLARWRELLQHGIGLHLASSDEQTLAFRMDQHQRRIIIQRGPQEDFLAVGWQLRDQATLDEVLKRLQRLGIQAQPSQPEEAAQRGVKRFWRVLGPKRMAVELFWEPLLTDKPLNMLSAGFITGSAGMGHLAITSRKPQQMQRFWQEIFDARASDHIVERIAGVTLDIDFFRVNERHHSIAIARLRGLPMDPIRTRVQHMNMLTTSVSELTNAYLRCRTLGFEMAHEIGEHPNDREQSFYVMSPSGFELELGCNARVVDEAHWRTTSYQGISLWGHRPQKSGAWHTLTTNLANFARGTRSLLKPEYSPL
ncbi:VOC family protein [Pseudomonas sp. GM25]|uniref:VOC family protein n=1 Tax=Pseudomonas sp. GM25 TaxID=1144327 RepID=UPI00026FEBA3|nr:VOC family protein [Pseudomonas sp. GM25]EJM27462.1 Glyoxalase/Bleomycin resistance protein/Dioxygenase superfamily [Pseudomonas sp. GM25]